MIMLLDMCIQIEIGSLWDTQHNNGDIDAKQRLQTLSSIGTVKIL